MNNDLENTNSDQLLDPKELAAAFEHTMNFVKGDTEALPDMMHHSGRLLLKLSRRLSTTQMVLLVGALTLGAIFVAKRVEEALDDDDDNGQQRALGGGAQGNRGGGSSSAQASGSSKGSSSDNSGNQGGKSGSASNSGNSGSDSSQKASGKQSGNK